MKIHGVILSPWTARVAKACYHKGLKIKMGLPEGGLKTPEYLALNPLGKIPTLQDGKTILPESTAILAYLDAKYPKKTLQPKKPKAVARAHLVAAVCQEYVQPPPVNLFRMFIGQNPRTPAQVRRDKADLAKALDILERYIAPGLFAIGKSFTIADCYTVPALFFVTRILKKPSG